MKANEAFGGSDSTGGQPQTRLLKAVKFCAVTVAFADEFGSRVNYLARSSSGQGGGGILGAASWDIVSGNPK